MHSTNYVLIFVLILTAAVAVALTGLRQATKSQADLNEEIFEKRAILAAVDDHLGEGVTAKSLSDDEVLKIFDSQIEQVALNMEGQELDIRAEDIDMAKERKKVEANRNIPLFIYNSGSEKFYIVSVRGNGLWDEIWGNIALEADLNTIAGASFDHRGETPGLGAEIKDNPTFPAQFKGKKIFNGNDYVSVLVRKGGAKDKNHEVDGISGATVTSDGVTEMLDRGIEYYLPYFEKVKGSTGNSVQGFLIPTK